MVVLDDDETGVPGGDPPAYESPPGGRHSVRPPRGGKGSWLLGRGESPDALAGRIIAVAAYKGGVGKTFLAYELAYMLDAILLDLDWDRGNASRAWGYREETRAGSPLLDAIERKRVPRALAGGPWRPDLVPCSADFGVNQPHHEKMTEWLEMSAMQWASDLRRPVVVDTHPGAGSATFGAVASAHLTVVPAVLGEREMEATEGMVAELKSYRLLLVPNMVGLSPPERYIRWLERIAARAFVPVGPPVSDYRWLRQRARRMAVTAADPVPARSRQLVEELHAVGGAVLEHVRAA